MNDAPNPDGSPDFNLKGQCLIAMPGMGDQRFARAVILICSHSDEGSMGFILNQMVVTPTFVDILDELGLEEEQQIFEKSGREMPVYRGGPVEKGRGFVLHTLDFGTGSTARVGDIAGLTATVDALKKLSSDHPPDDALMLLGYAGWSAGQLEQEIAENGWLTVPSSHELIFDTEPALKYDAALAVLGVSEATLSSASGHA